MKSLWYVYISTNTLTGKRYIGQKKGVFNQTYFGSGKHLKRALSKYGQEVFVVAKIASCRTKHEADQTEKQVISFFDAQHNLKFYNIASGGQGGDVSGLAAFRESQVFKIAAYAATFKRRAAEVHGGLYGYDKSVYTGSNSKLSVKCETHGYFEITPHSHISGRAGCPACGRERTARRNRGRPLSAERRAKISAAHKGKQLTEEHRWNISVGLRAAAIERERHQNGRFK